MKDNMFSDAYFGKPYKTRDGRKAIYVEKVEGRHKLLSKGCFGYRQVNTLACGLIFPNQLDKDDIVSVWEELIDEEELDELAKSFSSFTDVNRKDIEWVFKAGYRKAKNNI